MYFCLMKIGKNAFTIIIHRENEHPPPHCHIRWSDGTESWVLLPTLRVVFGKELTKAAENVILENLEKLINAWEEYHPKPNYELKKTKKGTK